MLKHSIVLIVSQPLSEGKVFFHRYIYTHKLVTRNEMVG